MRNLTLLIGVVVGLLVSGSVWAADGDRVPHATHPDGQTPNRAGWSGDVYYLCDSASGNGARTCGLPLTAPLPFDLGDTGKGIPDLMIIRISNATGCTAAYSVDINTFEAGYDATPAATVDAHDLVTLNATTTRAVIPWTAGTDRYIDATTSNMTNCSNFDVTIELRYEKKGLL